MRSPALPARASKKRAEAARAARADAPVAYGVPVSVPRSIEDLAARTRFEPAEVEPRLIAEWLQSGLFHPEPLGSAEKNYSIAIPPPNVTGALHMGHAFGGTIQDALIRQARLRGRRTKWIFGTDHAGIATQTQVERQLISEGTTREALGREAFVERTWRWRELYGRRAVQAPWRLLRLRG
jgi:valyl-tRNA synthetase